MNKFCRLVLVLIISGVNVYAQQELVFSHPHGFYEEPFTLDVSVTTPNATILYTLDGTNPLTSDNVFAQPSPASININPDNTDDRDTAPGYVLTLCATESDTLITDIVSRTYLFLNRITALSPHNQKPGPGWMDNGINDQEISYGLDPGIYDNPQYSASFLAAFMQIPSMSIVTDLDNLFDPDSGIYVRANMHGIEWERVASLELLNPDGSEGFQINCGIRMRGGWSRHPNNPKHAFRVFFRKEYGEGKLDYPLFGDEGTDTFDKFDLRTSQNYSWSYYGNSKNTFMRDVFSRDAQGEMGQPYTRSRFYHLFINGTYWGLFQTQERSEASFAEAYFGGNKEDYDTIKRQSDENWSNEVEATDGNLDAWRKLWDMGETGFENNDRYYEVQGLNPDGTLNPQFEKLLDVDNLIDYMINTFYVGDFDGPVSAFMGNNGANNFFCIYDRVNPDGFKFFRHDAEHSLFNDGDGDTCCGEDRTGPFSAGQNFASSNPHWIHQRLSENVLYRARFADRVYKHFFNDGALTYEKSVQRILKRKAEIDLAIIAESARWGDSKTSPARNKDDWENAINYIINEFLPGRENQVIGQLIGKGLFTMVNPPLFNQHGGIVDKGYTIAFESTSSPVYYTLDGTDPLTLVSSDGNLSTEVVSVTSAKKAIVPQGDIGSEWRSNLDYPDDSWLDCIEAPGGIGYENNTGYENLISLDIAEYMVEANPNANSSAYIRIPFEVSAELLSSASSMVLRMKFDDGFVAYINGVKVTEQYAPADPQWNSFATEVSAEALNYQSFNISTHLGQLQQGTNLLAIHGLNISFTSSDFIMLPVLELSNSAFNGSPSENAIAYNGPFEINETVTVKARSQQNANWSPLTEAQFLIGIESEALKITELHYHPLVIDTIVNDTEYEFIEFKNVSNAEINVTAATFVNGIEFSFPPLSVIPAGGFLVIASNAIEFFNRYGFEPYAEFEGQLNNGGERVVLVDAAGDTLFDIRYNDRAPWPEQADGSGYSLVAKSAIGSGDPALSDYWLASGNIHGSPGADDVVSGLAETKPVKLPLEYSLGQNFPNPFNPQTTINYSIANNSKVKITVFDITGRTVKVLLNEYKNAGSYRLSFNGDALASGIYFYRIDAGNFSAIKKMVFIK